MTREFGVRQSGRSKSCNKPLRRVEFGFLLRPLRFKVFARLRRDQNLLTAKAAKRE
jgi:hypothetical protein